MLTQKQLSDFADLAVKIGVNIQPKQKVAINSPVECAFFARLIAQKAYDAGAGFVEIIWNDDFLSRLVMEKTDVNVLENIPEWKVARYNHLVEGDYAVISIKASDPALYSGIDMEKITKVSRASSVATVNFRKATMSGKLRWLIISIPTTQWATTVFKDCDSKTAVDKLWDAIAVTMRLNTPDPVKAWREHCEKTENRAKYLNQKQFDHVILTNAKGTNLKVGLPKNHVWTGAGEPAQDGVMFVANMPTEEIFTAPHRLKTEGKVFNALPLCHNGTIIDDFWLEFKQGRVVDYDAKQGKDALKSIIETDDGSHYLGEVALLGKNSPIAKLGILFYNTLFDENASCHIALGKGYPSTVKGGEKMSVEQLLQCGVNDSMEHCDFMIGTPDLSVIGVSENGEKTTLFVDGEWVI